MMIFAPHLLHDELKLLPFPSAFLGDAFALFFLLRSTSSTPGWSQGSRNSVLVELMVRWCSRYGGIDLIGVSTAATRWVPTSYKRSY